MNDVIEPKYKTIQHLTNNKTYVLIPKGIKYYLYFTFKDKKPICLLYDKYKKYIKNVYVSFNICLSTGTIFYGTLFHNTFVIENLLLYKNNKIKNNIYNLDIILYILKYEINERTTTQSMCVKIPFMTNVNSVYTFSNCDYKVYGIVEYNTYNIFLLKNMFGNFIIKKDIRLSNVYNLYLTINKEDVFYCNACINDIKTTNLINNLFKNNINYNTNEYSDDETDKVDIKYVYITCLYIPQLKNWKPYQENIKKDTDTYNTIKNIETNYETNYNRDKL